VARVACAGAQLRAVSGRMLRGEDTQVIDSNRMPDSATVEIQMPQMGESVTEGTVLEWHKREGEFVQEGETVVEVSTDKVDAEVPAPASGTITKILARADETVQVGQALAELSRSATLSGDGQTTAAATSQGEATAARDAAVEAADGGRASPVARRIAAANGVELSSVK